MKFSKNTCTKTRGDSGRLNRCEYDDQQTLLIIMVNYPFFKRYFSRDLDDVMACKIGFKIVT